jgi:putative endopeptidase
MNKKIYLKDDKKYKIIRKKFCVFLKKIFSVVFGEKNKYDVKKIFRIEKKISESLLDYEDVIYIKNTYNIFNQHSCKEELSFDWNKFALALGFKHLPKNFIVENPAYLKNVFNFLQDWKKNEFEEFWIYQIIVVSSKYNSQLNKLFSDFFCEINKTPIYKNINTKKEALNNVEIYMNTYISKKYIDLFKNEKEISFTKKLAERYLDVLKKRLYENKWLHLDTRRRSIKKLQNMIAVIGYKSEWENDPDLEYSSVDAWENYTRFNEWSVNRDISLVGKRMLSRNVWLQSEEQNVFDVNAYYNSLENELIIPNAILQKPFVDIEKDMAYNLASIGTAIGHEMIHAFDDDGYCYDENRVYVEKGWWRESDMKEYQKKQNAIIKQYEDAGNADNLKLDGKLTLSENIADICGFLLTENVLLDYLTEKQIYGSRQDKYLKEFYINYAKNWRSNQSIKFFKKKIQEDEHSHSKYRVNCVLSNSKNFQRVFGIVPGDKMYFEPEEIW